MNKLIPRLSPTKHFSLNSCKVTRRPNLKHIQKIKKENTKDETEPIHKTRPKHREIQRIRVLYRPINPHNKFHSSSLGINDMVRKDNVSLISNDSIRNLILKFREEREKEISERKFQYKEKTSKEIQKEKNTNFLMLRAMLRKDPITIQAIIKRNQNKERQMNKCASMRSIVNHKNFPVTHRKIWNRSTFFPRESLTSEKSNNNNNSNFINNNSSNIFNNSINASRNISILAKQNKITKKEIWKKDFLSKLENKKKAYLKKYEAKIMSAYSIVLPGRPSSIKNAQNPRKKFNQDCAFSYWNFISKKLEEISIFGIFDGNGPYGKGIALCFKNYIINYFKKGEDMKVTLKKDNFYSIMYNSFINAHNYLIKNSSRLNINMKYSGATGIVVLYPHNNSNKIYCANVGRNKCVFYTMMGAIRLSYELFPNRASERFRISLFKHQQNKKLQNDNKDINPNEYNPNNKNMMMNNTEEIVDDNDIETKIILKREKAIFLQDFIELDISRCIGNLAAEELGVIPGPEIMESDIRLNKGKALVIGTESLWKYLTEEEVGEIVIKHYSMTNSEAACKELLELAKERWKEKTTGYDDISVIVVFFDSKNL